MNKALLKKCGSRFPKYNTLRLAPNLANEQTINKVMKLKEARQIFINRMPLTEDIPKTFLNYSIIEDKSGIIIMLLNHYA